MKNLFAFLLFILLHECIYAQFEETETQINSGKFEEAYAYLISAKNYFIKNSDSITVFECNEWIRMESLFEKVATKHINSTFLQSVDDLKAKNQFDSLKNEKMAQLISKKEIIHSFQPLILELKMIKKVEASDLYGAIGDCDYMIEKGIATTSPGFAYYWRGLCQLQLEQKQKGCLDLSKAGELGFQGVYEKIRIFCK